MVSRPFTEIGPAFMFPGKSTKAVDKRIPIRKNRLSMSSEFLHWAGSHILTNNFAIACTYDDASGCETEYHANRCARKAPPVYKGYGGKDAYGCGYGVGDQIKVWLLRGA